MDDEINYEYDDFSIYVLADNDFNKRFIVIQNIKNEMGKAAYIVNDIKLDKICFLKVKIRNAITNYEMEVYDKLKSLSHENIETIYDIVVTPKFYFIVIEYINGVNLLEYKTKSVSDQCNIIINNKKLITIINQILDGMKYLHKMRIIHGDVKLENIMICNDNVKIIDFDLARILKNQDEYILADHIYGTENYIAPESFDLKVYSKKTDLWALGIVLYKLITNKFPYIDKPDKICHFYIKNNFKKLDFEELNKYKSIYSINIIDDIKKLLEFKDEKRLSISNIKFQCDDSIVIDQDSYL
jgi:serine/threonine protein kinase